MPCISGNLQGSPVNNSSTVTKVSERKLKFRRGNRQKSSPRFSKRTLSLSWNVCQRWNYCANFERANWQDTSAKLRLGVSESSGPTLPISFWLQDSFRCRHWSQTIQRLWVGIPVVIGVCGRLVFVSQLWAYYLHSVKCYDRETET